MRKCFAKYLTVLSIGILMLFLSSCNEQAKDIDVQNILDEQMKTAEINDQVQITEDVIYSFYDIEEADIEKIVTLKSGNGANADEITVIKAKDGQAEKIKEALNLRVTMINEAFVDYNPDEKTKIDNAIVKVSGNYLLLAVCDNPTQMEKLFMDGLK